MPEVTSGLRQLSTQSGHKGMSAFAPLQTLERLKGLFDPVAGLGPLFTRFGHWRSTPKSAFGHLRGLAEPRMRQSARALRVAGAPRCLRAEGLTRFRINAPPYWRSR